jgi:hypothetical protein
MPSSGGAVKTAGAPLTRACAGPLEAGVRGRGPRILRLPRGNVHDHLGEQVGVARALRHGGIYHGPGVHPTRPLRQLRHCPCRQGAVAHAGLAVLRIACWRVVARRCQRCQQRRYRREQLPVIKDWLRDNRLESGSEESLPFNVAGVRGQRYGRDTAVPGHGSDRLEALQASTGLMPISSTNRSGLAACRFRLIREVLSPNRTDDELRVRIPKLIQQRLPLGRRLGCSATWLRFGIPSPITLGGHASSLRGRSTHGSGGAPESGLI